MPSIDEEIEGALGIDDPLEALYTETLLQRKMRPPRKVADPAVKNSLDAAAKKLRDLYLLPENWERKRGLCLIDKSSKTLIGNFSEYVHRTTTARKLIREHQPIHIDGSEEIDGYLGERFSWQRGESWDRECFITVPVLLDELMVEAPAVRLHVHLRLGAIKRAELCEATQFAAMNGETVIQFPAGTNIWEACGTDTKAAVRKEAA